MGWRWKALLQAFAHTFLIVDLKWASHGSTLKPYKMVHRVWTIQFEIPEIFRAKKIGIEAPEVINMRIIFSCL